MAISSSRTVKGVGSQYLVIPGTFAGSCREPLGHYFTGVRMGAPLAFSSTTTNLAGSVLLALRPTT